MSVKTAITFVLALIGSSYLYAAQNAFKSKDGDTANQWYRVVSAGDSIRISLGGTVIPFQNVTLSAQIPGRIKNISGREGDAFRHNDLLVAIDDTELRAKRSSAVAQLGSANAKIQDAHIQYNRELWSPRSKQAMGGMYMPNLFDNMFGRSMSDAFGDTDTDAERRADLYSAGSHIQLAQNAALSALAEIRAIDSKIRDASSIAPFDGIITKKFVEVGDTVQPGQPLIEYANLKWLQIEVDVPSRVISSLKEGDILENGAELDNGRTESIRVAQIFPMADFVRHTVKVKFDLKQGVARPGDYIKVRLPDIGTAKDSGIVKIPTSALQFRGSLPGVYVKGLNGEGQLRLVRVGKHISETEVTILSGLQEGDEVLKNPAPR